MKQVLGIDPGLTTGWSLLQDPWGHMIVEGQESFERMPAFLHGFQNHYGPVETIVMEDYQLFKHKALQQSGSKLETTQVIGMVKMWAFFYGIPIILQSPQVKTIAERLSGRVPKGAHKNSHHVDAYNHAIYWLQSQGRYKSAFEREVAGQ